MSNQMPTTGRIIARIQKDDKDLSCFVDFEQDFGPDQPKGFLSYWDTGNVTTNMHADTIEDEAKLLIKAPVSFLLTSGASLGNVEGLLEDFGFEETFGSLWDKGFVEVLAQADTEEI